MALADDRHHPLVSTAYQKKQMTRVHHHPSGTYDPSSGTHSEIVITLNHRELPQRDYISASYH